MSTNGSKSKTTSNVHAHTSTKESTAMSKSTPKSNTSHAAHGHPSKKENANMPTIHATRIETAAVTQTPGSIPPEVATPTGPVDPPPANAVVPVPPAYSPPTPGEFKTVLPRQRELTALATAISDVTKFADFDTVMGSTAPSRAEVLQALTTGSKWTTQRQATQAWLRYAGLEEGLSWEVIRTQQDSLRPAFALAAKRNPALAEKYTGLAKLLAAPKTAAQQGAATRKANKQATAEGKPATHGKVGKQNEKKAQKEALAAQRAAGTGASAASPVAAQAAQVPPVNGSASSAVATPPPTGAPVNGAAQVAGSTNGAGH
jgi:hypothetical protein